MRCEHCGEREANVHLTQIANGETRKLHLCADCAAKSGIQVGEPVSLAELLAQAGLPPAAPEPAGPDTRCPRCHMRRSDFKKTSRLGCSDCYTAFGEDLKGVLAGLHKGSLTHRGKTPAAARGARRRRDRAEELAVRLREAIGAERFEEAARVRDELRALREDENEPA